MRFTADGKDAFAELDRLCDIPFDTLVELEAALALVFQTTQRRVHIDTRSLLPSGKIESETHGGVWIGEFTFGGSTTGPKDPVLYARHEQRRGGEHDFMEPARHMDHLFEKIIEKHLRG